MQSLGLLVLLVAAASAVDILQKDDKVSYRCNLRTHDHGIILKDRKFPIYLCNSDDGDHLIFASETFHDDNLDAILDKETVLKLKDLSAVKRPKRQYGSGFGGAGSMASAGAFGGGSGFGGGPGYYGGGPGGGFGGGFGGAQSSASSNAFGGGAGGGWGK